MPTSTCPSRRLASLRFQPSEVVEELADETLAVGRAAQLLLVVPVDAGEHAVQPPGVGVLDGVAGYVQRFAQPHGLAGDDGPAGILGHEELVLVGVGEGRLPRHAQVVDGALHLLVKAVGQALEEEYGKDVVLVVGRIYLPAQYVGGLPQLALQFLAGQRHCFPPGGRRRLSPETITPVTESLTVSRRSLAAIASGIKDRVHVCRHCQRWRFTLGFKRDFVELAEVQARWDLFRRSGR